MNTSARASIFACLVLCLNPWLGSEAIGQPTTPAVLHQSDVIYGGKFGVALTTEVFTPASPNGNGVIWVVSSSGKSSREQTFRVSFERRIAPLTDRGYTVFAVIHGSAPLFNVQDQVSDIRHAVRFVRHHAQVFGIDYQRIGISGSSSGGLLALVVAMEGLPGDPTAEDVVERLSSSVQAVGCFFPPTDLVNRHTRPEHCRPDAETERRYRSDISILRRRYEHRGPAASFSTSGRAPDAAGSISRDACDA